MVGIVLVSHSRSLALSVQELIRTMTGPDLPLALAAGAGENHHELGTDAIEISEAIASVHSRDGVLVIMDMGSAILSAETALDLLDEPLRVGVKFCGAPFVEGAVAACVTANLGAPLDEVYAEAIGSLRQKENFLHPAQASPTPLPVEPEKKPDAVPDQTGPGKKARVVVRNVHGLHARPAARLISESRPFHSTITVSNLFNHRGPVSIKSLSSLASLEILQGNEIEFSAEGDDADAALEKISKFVESGLGDDLSAATNGKGPKKKSKPTGPAQPVVVSSGIAIGPGVYLGEAKLEIPDDKVEDVEAEVARLRKAVAIAQETLESRSKEMSAFVGAENAGIYEAQILVLQDPELIGKAEQIIREEKANASLAWNRANQDIVTHYKTLTDEYLRERAIDLEDVGRQVLELLVVKKPEEVTLTAPSIVIADNLTPSQVSTLPRKFMLGVILLDGGPTAHSSILLRALGIPAFVQARSLFKEAKLDHPGTIALDGTAGSIWLNPAAALIAELTTRQTDEQQRDEEEKRASSQPGATRDGQRIEIFANIGDVSDVEPALRCGAEGVGLLRTEFLFIGRESAPTEDEQIEALLAIAKSLGNKPMIVRTLDAGGDKQLSYLQMPSEENPFLGVRAVRLCFSHEELFTTQLRAILRAGHWHDFRIMFPMIANLNDLNRAWECLETVHRDLEKENVPHLWPVQTGIMIEIPSAALQSETLAKHADFFSIGTNDLTQYTLAADRGNPELASYQDALHPSVLRLIDMVVSGARKHDRLVAICGEAAADETAAAVFIGLGVRELSMTGTKIPRLKARLRRQSLTEMQKLAHAALHCQSAAEVRALKW
jgi:phosphoenolpyruvate-protein phosphotransferase/dihydroxyacetone kinase phosphotransfer subunit